MTAAPSTPNVDVLVRIERLAHALEAEGFLGQAKLYRALSRSLLARAAYESDRPRAGGALLDEMALAREELAQAGVSAAVLQALDVSQAAAAEKRATLWNEIGAVHVCRLCGELFVGPTPEYCPTCGSHALAYWEVPPIYHLEPIAPTRVLDALATLPETLRAILDGLSEADTRRKPAPDEWSVRETVQHLAMAQGVLAARTEKLLAEDNPSLESLAVWTFKASDEDTIGDVMEQFDDVRGDLLATLRGIPYDAWLRAGWHTEFGEVTLLQQASYFAKHERFHLPQLHQLRAFVTGRA